MIHVDEVSQFMYDDVVYFKLHTSLGPGLFESVYKEILDYEFGKLNLTQNCKQALIPDILCNSDCI